MTAKTTEKPKKARNATAKRTGEPPFFRYVNFSDRPDMEKLAGEIAGEIRKSIHGRSGSQIRVFSVTSDRYNEYAIVFTNDPRVATKGDALGRLERKLSAIYGP